MEWMLYGACGTTGRMIRRFPSRAMKSARLAAICTTSKMIAFAIALAAFAGAFAVAR
jgi:hypothetical protein